MRTLSKLLRYGLRHRIYLSGAFFTMIATTVSSMAVPYMLGTAIDEAIGNGTRSTVIFIALGVILVSILRGILSFGQSYLAEALSQKATFDLREDFFKKLQSLSFGFYDQQQTGNLMSRATADIEAVRMFISMGLVRGISIFVMRVSVISIMSYENWRLALVCFIFMPPIIWRAVLMSRKLRTTWMEVQSETGKLTAVLQENVTGIKIVKIFGAAKYEQNKFGEKARKLADLSYKAAKLFAVQGPLMTFIFTLSTAAILFVGGYELNAERITAGGLASFIFYMAMLAMPIRMMGWLINTYSRAQSAGDRIYEVLDAESGIKDKTDAVEIKRVQGRVEFHKVSAGYNTTDSVVDGLEFSANPGQIVAIMGAPGSGKSTLVHLIARFYDVNKGKITIDDIDIRDIKITSVRKNVGVVFQDVFLFAASIKENIAYGLEDVTIEKIIAVSKIAHLHEFIEGLPQGYDTLVGERGVTLSGGQRQRLAIARTLLLDPPILILDDSTSSVDSKTESEIQRALESVMKNRTVFVIAHRATTISQANSIIVLEKGKIVERGTHDELLKLKGTYHRIYNHQINFSDGDSTPEQKSEQIQKGALR